MKPLPTLAQIGQRVSLRLHDPEGGFRDLLGHLVAVNQVRKKDGQIVTFDPDRISLWKVVPSNPIFTGIFLYDTMSRTQRELTISDGKALRMYCCGPTVYRDAHVGNLRTFLLGSGRCWTARQGPKHFALKKFNEQFAVAIHNFAYFK